MASFSYKVSILFHKGTCANPIGYMNVPYNSGGLVRADQVKFYKKKLVINATRSTFASGGDILTNPSITLHHVIETSILLYYANCLNFPLINSITIEAYKSGHLLYVYKTNKENTPILFDESVHRPATCSFLPNTDFAALDKKGRALRISISYWLEAINSRANQICFERAWTAFNALYTYYGNKTTERDNHKYIRDYITNHPVHFPEIAAKASSLPQAEIRSFRWKIWMRNQANRGYHTPVENLMTSFTDTRLKNVFSGLFNSRDISRLFSHPTDLVKDALLRAKLANIQTALAIPGIVNNMDVALLLSINYAYHLRNQRFHGGTINSVCKIYPTAEDIEYGKIADFLITIVKEIYKVEGLIPVQP